MNKVELIGRLTRDPRLDKTTRDISYSKFNIAVKRTFKTNDGQDADFISCVAWEKIAENLCNIAHKGDRVAVVGHLQSRQYEAEGTTRYALEIMVDELVIIDYKKKEEPEF